jgi:hypothetical protein
MTLARLPTPPLFEQSRSVRYRVGDNRHTPACFALLAANVQVVKIIFMTIHFRAAPRRRSLIGRLSGGAMLLLLLIGVGFAPLCSPSSLGTLPCCHQASSLTASTASQTPCCAIHRNAGGNEPIAISRAVTSPRPLDTVEPGAVLTFAPASNPPITTDLAWQVFRAPDRPLHIRNSVFLI